MLRKVYTFIDSRIKGNMYIQIGLFAFIFIFFFCLSMFKVVDSTPATQEEYAPLISQQEKIVSNFNTVYNYDNFTIVPADKNILVTLSNTQCKLICSFDKNLKFINYEKKDSCYSKPEAIFLSAFISFFISMCIVIIIAVIVPFIISLILKLLEKICRFLI